MLKKIEKEKKILETHNIILLNKNNFDYTSFGTKIWIKIQEKIAPEIVWHAVEMLFSSKTNNLIFNVYDIKAGVNKGSIGKLIQSYEYDYINDKKTQKILLKYLLNEKEKLAEKIYLEKEIKRKKLKISNIMKNLK
jgi:hypothetical protein